MGNGEGRMSVRGVLKHEREQEGNLGGQHPKPQKPSRRLRSQTNISSLILKDIQRMEEIA